jgi:hypothetical protein
LGGEYRNLNSFFQSLGIAHRLACPHTHQQNGSVERKHRHIVETGLTLLAHASVPFRYWSDAFTTACFLINHTPTRVLNMKTPIELLLNEQPDYTFLRCLGVLAGRIYAHTTNVHWNLDPRSVSSLATVLFIKVIVVFMFPLIVSTYLGMSCLMSMFFRFPNYLCPPLSLRICTHPPLLLTNLKMLHILLCCYLTMVQELDVVPI